MGVIFGDGGGVFFGVCRGLPLGISGSEEVYPIIGFFGPFCLRDWGRFYLGRSIRVFFLPITFNDELMLSLCEPVFS